MKIALAGLITAVSCEVFQIKLTEESAVDVAVGVPQSIGMAQVSTLIPYDIIPSDSLNGPESFYRYASSKYSSYKEGNLIYGTQQEFGKNFILGDWTGTVSNITDQMHIGAGREIYQHDITFMLLYEDFKKMLPDDVPTWSSYIGISLEARNIPDFVLNRLLADELILEPIISLDYTLQPKS
jgi:hypothetical protein